MFFVDPHVYVSTIKHLTYVDVVGASFSSMSYVEVFSLDLGNATKAAKARKESSYPLLLHITSLLFRTPSRLHNDALALITRVLAS